MMLDSRWATQASTARSGCCMMATGQIPQSCNERRSQCRPLHQRGRGMYRRVDAAISDLEGVEAHYTASAIQYLWRWKSKGGVEDLQKAQWYVSRLIETEAL